MMASSTRTGLTYHLTELSLGLKHFGHNIVVVHSGGEQQRGLEKLLTNANIPVFIIPTIDAITFRMKSNASQLGRIIDKERIDIIHANGLAHLFNAHYGKMISSRKPTLVMSIHSYFRDQPYAKAYLIAVSILLNLFADLVLPISKMVSEELVKSGLHPRKIMTVYNALNLTSFDEALMSSNHLRVQNIINEILGKPSILSMSARLVPLKGHMCLLKAMYYVKNEYPDIRCVVAGTGPLLNKLRKMVSSLHIENNVIFVGYLRYEHLLQILRVADIAVVTSSTETFCHAMIEALAAKKPIITTPVGVAPEIMKYGVGLMVSKNRPKVLANAITWMLDNPKKATEMGLKGRQVVEQMFSMDAIANKLGMAYESAYASKHSFDSSRKP
jgi:glycosyltransferase involved in cell wall biosynthesis